MVLRLIQLHESADFIASTCEHIFIMPAFGIVRGNGTEAFFNVSRSTQLCPKRALSQPPIEAPDELVKFR